MKILSKLLTISLIISLFSACGIFKNPKTYDKGVVINGVKWATRNVDEFGAFAETPESFGKFYQWNRKKAWILSFDRRQANWDSSADSSSIWKKENDPCPKGWRVPTYMEFETLINSNSIWTTINGVRGRLFGSGDSILFLPAAGLLGNNNGLSFDRNRYGHYWSNAEVRTFIDGIEVNNNTLVFSLAFDNDTTIINHRLSSSNGLNVRCVVQ
jgi:uncharacterized protein (TIGR02145 family)